MKFEIAFMDMFDIYTVILFILSYFLCLYMDVICQKMSCECHCRKKNYGQKCFKINIFCRKIGEIWNCVHGYLCYIHGNPLFFKAIFCACIGILFVRKIHENVTVDFFFMDINVSKLPFFCRKIDEIWNCVHGYLCYMHGNPLFFKAIFWACIGILFVRVFHEKVTVEIFFMEQ